MKKYIKIILILLGISLIFMIIFFLGRKISLNNYLNKTIEYSKKVNYSTNIILNIKDLNNSSKINYQIVHTSYIDKILIENYTDNVLTNNIYKYVVREGSKKGSYVYDGNEYKKSNDIDEEFNIDYQKLKNNIKSVKKSDNVVIGDISYKKYIVKMKSYDAYNLIYDSEVISKEDSNKYIDVEIYIDKTNNFIYKITYEINDLNNAGDENSLDYNVEIINKDVNNIEDIKLPF